MWTAGSERRDVAREQLTSLAWQAGAHGMCARDQTSTTTTLTAERALTAERTDCEQHCASKWHVISRRSGSLLAVLAPATVPASLARRSRCLHAMSADSAAHDDYNSAVLVASKVKSLPAVTRTSFDSTSTTHAGISSTRRRSQHGKPCHAPCGHSCRVSCSSLLLRCCAAAAALLLPRCSCAAAAAAAAAPVAAPRARQAPQAGRARHARRSRAARAAVNAVSACLNTSVAASKARSAPGTSPCSSKSSGETCGNAEKPRSRGKEAREA